METSLPTVAAGRLHHGHHLLLVLLLFHQQPSLCAGGLMSTST
jgi:hypothetical protein